jgi:membrane protein YqaA with SNARE-associated domain
LKALKLFLERYKKFVMALLAPLGGPWAVFVIATVDSALFGIPLDPVMAYYVHTDPRHSLLYAFMGAIGSALGSLVPYTLGYKGGEAFVVKRVGERKFRRIHGLSEKYGDLALVIPSMLPPPTPFKLFVFSAGIAEMNVFHFMLAIFTGRLARFLLLAALTIRFGPEIVAIMQTLVKTHPWLTLGIFTGAILLIYLVVKWRSTHEPPAEEMVAD